MNNNNNRVINNRVWLVDDGRLVESVIEDWWFK